MSSRKFLVSLGVGLLILAFNVAASATSIQVNIQVSPITNLASEVLAFDFTPGGGPLANTVTISNFVTDGTLGSAGPNSGNVTGTLPGAVTLSTAGLGSSSLNEYLTGIALGTNFSFQLDATNNAPGASSFPDAFSLFILDPTFLQPVFTTSDPSGSSNALMLFNIDGTSQGALSVYTGEGFKATASVPEPGTLSLVGVGILFLFWKRRYLSRTCDAASRHASL